MTLCFVKGFMVIKKQLKKYLAISLFQAKKLEGHLLLSGLKNVPKQVVKQVTGIRDDRTLNNYQQYDED